MCSYGLPFTTTIILVSFGVLSLKAESPFNEDFYSLSATDSIGRLVQFNTFRNKVLLIVNVASECGYTDSHYTELVKLHERFWQTGLFAILAFPCNQFGLQEPKGIHDIVKFATDVYGARFMIFDKVSVIGTDASPLWKHLEGQARVSPNWNFWKYLVDHRGYVINAWGPQTGVFDLTRTISDAVENARMDQLRHRPDL